MTLETPETGQIPPEDTPIYTQLSKEYAAIEKLNRFFGLNGYPLPEERLQNDDD